MSYYEEQLFYACTNFCEVFFKLLCEKDKIKNKWCLYDEQEERIRFVNEMLDHAYERLFCAVEDWENGCKGVRGQNKYKLILEEVKND